MNTASQAIAKEALTNPQGSSTGIAFDYINLGSLPEVWRLTADKFGDTIALQDPHAKPKVAISYRDLTKQIEQFASGLQAANIQPQAKIALFADNSPRWFIADQGIMTSGAVDVVRSASADSQELAYILENSDSTALVVENFQTLSKLSSNLDKLPIDLIVLLSDEIPEDSQIKTLNYQQLMTLGQNNQLQPVEQHKNTLATLLYTSGTTGKPKGVMLTHGNLLHQVNYVKTVFQPQPGDTVLSILPSWHAYERAAEYFFLSQGATQIYTSIRYFKQDLKEFQPTYMVGVPRLWESLYEGVQKQLSGQSASQQKLVKFFLKQSERYIMAQRIANDTSLEHFETTTRARAIAKVKAASLYPVHTLADKLVYRKIRAGIGNIKAVCSGGGSLAKYLDDFYQTINVDVFVGYGLTETSPITNARTPSHNVRGSAGRPLPETEIKIVDAQTKQDLPQGERGLVLIRGSQVMQGYYQNPEATAKAIDDEGWFDSGDLGWLTPYGDLVLTGRAKDTIVLSNGENIEPQPIEDACVRSVYIDQIMLVGQDQRALGALIVPNLETLQQWVTAQNLNLQIPELNTSPESMGKNDLYNPAIINLYREELNREIKNRPGYRADDRITDFRFVTEPFSQENGTMTQTFKVKRPQIMDKYQSLVTEIFAD
ncbi:long-chain fatty acid--CoA ligase [Pleurocapsa sp. CCALA 161]|uniref:AMP-binding protein n=1 Tax=Pleurocapsa sp. CCALA 161 TaxID=2107688 RepID=UPI000D04EF65|nr:AMP-binding protein [Pleurocapsa sp. CCALA 161]PSB10253.1 long-chain fatty acid--CoA ligase [Pleurocapsa sp. CCALA 161]